MDIFKAVIRGKFTLLNTFIKKNKKMKINELNFQLKNLGKNHKVN